jgi:hypothetical protein
VRCSTGICGQRLGLLHAQCQHEMPRDAEARRQVSGRLHGERRRVLHRDRMPAGEVLRSRRRMHGVPSRDRMPARPVRRNAHPSRSAARASNRLLRRWTATPGASLLLLYRALRPRRSTTSDMPRLNRRMDAKVELARGRRNCHRAAKILAAAKGVRCAAKSGDGFYSYPLASFRLRRIVCIDSIIGVARRRI